MYKLKSLFWIIFWPYYISLIFSEQINKYDRKIFIEIKLTANYFSSLL